MKLHKIENGAPDEGRDATDEEVAKIVDFIVSAGRDREEVEAMDEGELKLAYAKVMLGF